jgi:hypothetical protein
MNCVFPLAGPRKSAAVRWWCEGDGLAVEAGCPRDLRLDLTPALATRRERGIVCLQTGFRDNSVAERDRMQLLLHQRSGRRGLAPAHIPTVSTSQHSVDSSATPSCRLKFFWVHAAEMAVALRLIVEGSSARLVGARAHIGPPGVLRRPHNSFETPPRFLGHLLAHKATGEPAIGCRHFCCAHAIAITCADLSTLVASSTESTSTATPRRLKRTTVTPSPGIEAPVKSKCSVMV